jgi:SsrA-binding protein
MRRLQVKIKERGYTLVPLELYFRKGWAKVLLGLAKGRKQYDNRDVIRKKEDRRALRREAE